MAKNASVGQLARVSIRDVWKSESQDFTPWLKDNINTLSDAMDTITLVSAEREGAAGDFNVDLIAEDGNGNPVVIENQLEKSDHDHLGKLLTYMVSVASKTAVWITPNPRPEHIATVSWLNETYSADFYLLKVEAVRIDDSKPAPLFTLIVGPSEEVRQAGAVKEELGERGILRKKFWTELLESAKKAGVKVHSNISPGAYSWLGTSAGIMGVGYNYSVRKYDGAVEVYIDRGSSCDEWNKEMFGKLKRARTTIEKVFGGPLEWEELEGKRACRIKKTISQGGYRSDESQWPAIHEEMVKDMANLAKAFKPYIEKAKPEMDRKAREYSKKKTKE